MRSREAPLLIRIGLIKLFSVIKSLSEKVSFEKWLFASTATRTQKYEKFSYLFSNQNDIWRDFRVMPLTLIFNGEIFETRRLEIDGYNVCLLLTAMKFSCSDPFAMHYIAFRFTSNRFRQKYASEIYDILCTKYFRWRSDWKYYIHQLYYRRSLHHDILNPEIKYIFAWFLRVIN